MRLSFDSIANQFANQRGLPPHALRAWIQFVDEVAKGVNITIVEPGIGTGRVALPLAVAGHHVTGTDISRPMLFECSRQADHHQIHHRVVLHLADATDLPFDDYTFDFGFIAQLLYLVPDWAMVLDELARVVKPGGCVVRLDEPTQESPALQLWSTTWRKMIEQTGYRHLPSLPEHRDVHDEFLRRWPDCREVELANWGFGQTVAEARVGYRDRVRGLYADIPDVEFDATVASFLDWADAEFPDPDTDLGGQVALTALVAAL